MALTSTLSGCLVPTTESTNWSDVEVSSSLQIVPQAALAKAVAGGIEASLYSGDSTDAFLDHTYLIQGSRHVETTLSVYNGAPKGGSFLSNDKDGNAVIKGDRNDIKDAQLVIEMKSCKNPFTMNVNGQIFDNTSFTQGGVTLMNGAMLVSGNRLPGLIQTMSLGALAAQSTTNVKVVADGDCEFVVHFDVFGQALCNNILITDASKSTTISLANTNSNRIDGLKVLPADLTTYVKTSSDPFQDHSYVLAGTSKLVTQLTVTNPEKIDVTDAMAIIELKDVTGHFSVTVNGRVLNHDDFISGSPSMKDGAPFDASKRLPGFYALVAVGMIPANGSIQIEVIAESDCDLEVHFDVFGSLGCSKFIVNASDQATTIKIHKPACHIFRVGADTTDHTFKVNSTPVDLDCGFDSVKNTYLCSKCIDDGTVLTMTATRGGSTTGFKWWGIGPCEGKGPTCTLTIDQDYTVWFSF